jgi:hypothetical protein
MRHGRSCGRLAIWRDAGDRAPIHACDIIRKQEGSEMTPFVHERAAWVVVWLTSIFVGLGMLLVFG